MFTPIWDDLWRERRPEGGRHRLDDSVYDSTEETPRMAINGQIIRDALSAVGAVGKQMRSFDELAVGADGALRQAPAGLTAVGAASWLATQAQESDYFRATEEYQKKARYAPHIGRTFEMVTWDYNYLDFGRWCRRRGLVTNERTFVDNPRSLADYRWAWLGGVWFFEHNNLWPIANGGDHYKVSQLVNGGQGMVRDGRKPNHWDARSKMFDAFRRAGNALLPAGTAAPAPATSPSGLPTLREGDNSALVWRLAGFMNANYGAYSKIDRGPGPTCRLGPQCIAALTEFQRRSGIPTDPPFAVGPKTWAALTAAGFR